MSVSRSDSGSAADTGPSQLSSSSSNRPHTTGQQTLARGILLTNKLLHRPVGRAVQQPNQPTCIPNRLFEPQHLLVRAYALVLGFILVLLRAELLVRVADWEDEEQGVGWAWDEGEQVRIVDAVDVLKADGFGEAELVKKRGHYLGVVFCRE